MAARHPPKGTATQTPQQRYRTKELRAGVMQLNVRVPKKLSARIKTFVTAVREGKKPSDAFEKAFPVAAKAIVERHIEKLSRSRG
jgi:hypothetical protein